MNDAAVKEIAALAQGAQSAEDRITTVEGRQYSTTKLYEIEQKLAEPGTLVVHTLTGLAEYIEANKDGVDLDDAILHVVDPSRVDLVTKTQGDFHQRYRYISAVNYDRFAAVPTFGFGKYLDLENMNVALQALFEPSSSRAELLKVVGNVKLEGGVQRKDDGVAQAVTARIGIQIVDVVTVPNPVTLSPFRTFPEIAEQPRGLFVFRMKKQGEEILAALYEADGGSWRNEATRKVAEWLRDRVGSSVTVVA